MTVVSAGAEALLADIGPFIYPGRAVPRFRPGPSATPASPKVEPDIHLEPHAKGNLTVISRDRDKMGGVQGGVKAASLIRSGLGLGLGLGVSWLRLKEEVGWHVCLCISRTPGILSIPRFSLLAFSSPLSLQLHNLSLHSLIHFFPIGRASAFRFSNASCSSLTS